MGIGRPIGEQDPADFVLKPFSKEEKLSLNEFLRRGADAIESLVVCVCGRLMTWNLIVRDYTMSPTIKKVLLAVQITVAADLLVLNLGAVVVAPVERIVTPAP